MRIGAEKREATSEELSALINEARPFGFENFPVSGATTADIDEAHLWSFVREFEGDAFDAAGASGYPTKDVLERDLLLATQHAGELVPTVPGTLFGLTLALGNCCAFRSNSYQVCRRLDTVAGRRAS